MDRMAYVWAKAKKLPAARVWGNVRISGLQNDVPNPNVWSPEQRSEPGAQSTVVVKGSLIKRKEAAEEAVHPPSSGP